MNELPLFDGRAPASSLQRLTFGVNMFENSHYHEYIMRFLRGKASIAFFVRVPNILKLLQFLFTI